MTRNFNLKPLFLIILLLGCMIPVSATSNWTFNIHTSSGWFDPAEGTYTQYLFTNFTNVSDDYHGVNLAMDWATAVMMPWVAIWGVWIFVIIWCFYIMMVWIGSGTVEIPLGVGIISGTLWGMLFPEIAIGVFTSIIVITFAVVIFRMLAPKE